MEHTYACVRAREHVLNSHTVAIDERVNARSRSDISIERSLYTCANSDAYTMYNVINSFTLCTIHNNSNTVRGRSVNVTTSLGHVHLRPSATASDTTGREYARFG
jgi:hypothetical protein